MKNTLETRLGLFVALVMLATFFILVIVGGVEKFQRGIRAHVQFRSAQELKVGDRVKLAGVEVGKIEDITLTNGVVNVLMKLRANAPVKSDSKAAIKSAGLMGQSFVSLDFGTPGSKPLDDGGYIIGEEQADLSAIMQKLDTAADGIANMTKGFAGDEIHNLMSTLTDFISRNKDPLTAAISNFQSMSAQMASGQGTLGRLMYDDTLYTNALGAVASLQASGDDLKATLAEARKVVDNINAGEGTIGRLLKDEKLYSETTVAMTNLKEILQKMNQGQGTVGKLINDQEFYKNAKLTLQKLDKATEGLEDQGPLSVVGMLVNSLF